MMNIEKWTTERLILELTTEQDIDELAPMLLDDNVSMYLNEHISKIPTIEMAKSFLSSVRAFYNLTYTIRIKETNEAIGQIGYCIYLGDLTIFYWLGTKYQGKGYASEATVDLSHEIFSKSNIQTFSISFYTCNIASRKLAYKIGEKMLQQNPKWIVLDKEDKMTECEVMYLDEECVLIKAQDNLNSKSETYFSCSRNTIPDEYLHIGKKYTERLRYFDISKNGN